jgi:hypothetical protein
MGSLGTLPGIATRNVHRNYRRSAIAASAVVLGMLAMVNVRALLDGLIIAMRASVVDGQAGSIQIRKAGAQLARIEGPIVLVERDV